MMNKKLVFLKLKLLMIYIETYIMGAGGFGAGGTIGGG